MATAGSGCDSNQAQGGRRLPPELWRIAVHYLSDEDIRSLSLVSSSLRELVLADLFSHVTVCFGLWQSEASDRYVVGEEADTVMMGDDESELERLNVKACEILHHIARTPSFARVIKKFSVRAYLVHAGEGIFELFALKEALLVMTNITSFRYEGRCPLPNAAVLDALARSSGDVLRELCLPSSDVTRTALVKFKRLQTLILHRPYNPDHMFNSPEDSEVSVADGVEASRDTLTRLTLYGNALWRCPVRSLLDLHELEIILPPSLDGLELILHHCTGLRYVTFDLFMCENSRLVELLKAHPEALPRLVAFKLFFGHTDLLTREQTAVIANFLRGKKALRMLDLADNDISMEEGAEIPLGEMLRELPALEVLGLNAHHAFLPDDVDIVAFLRDHLPPQLSALFLNFTLDDEDMSFLGFIDIFRQLTSLRYLHIIDMLGTVDLKQQLLEDHPDTLQLVGYDSFLRWIEHDPEQDLPMYSLPWSDSKVRFSTAEDFGCKDWEWLFRYHAPGAIWHRDLFVP
ncbi:hypothetical protein L226DRAFT_511375 [Lentinus tigrinus ALCF2SS1-7]|uniref:F-box domain-containing protein n=1 Tax=Lentinus tigrinus ALCF2SS1-6 TaxID=1328759 RepID=A0A5C2RS16_9APHY|nr:hypothetical protein L227DRAFT_557826 [Lentinus tigrinus ALCF2SS1-6]RPD72686.1 hypothetical protein L226DRAFT_511375 [Lentinus tigrinus ALCF2SS1-7]